MLISLVPTPESQEKLHRAMKVFERISYRIRDKVFDAGLESFLDEMRYLFRVEGDPPWIPLAPRTVAERTELGYGPSSPILEREGFLRRSLTEPDMGPVMGFVKHTSADQPLWAMAGGFTEPIMTGNLNERMSWGTGNHVLTFATLDERFQILNRRRSMMLSWRQARMVRGDIDGDILEILRRILPRELPS